MKKSTKIIISAVLVALTSGFFYNEWSNEISDKVIYNGKELNYDTWWQGIEKPNGILKEYLNSGELSREEIWKDGKMTSHKAIWQTIDLTFSVTPIQSVVHEYETIYINDKDYIEKLYSNGKLGLEITYKDDKKISEVFYHEDGSKF